MPVPAPSVNSPLSRWGMPTANSMTSIPRWMSPLESATVLPCSSESSSASSSTFGVDQLDELHHHAGPTLRVPCAPFLLRFDGRSHRGVDVGGGGHQDLGLHFAGAWVHHVGGSGRRQVAAAAVDEMLNLCGHERVPRQNFGILGHPSNGRLALARAPEVADQPSSASVTVHTSVCIPPPPPPSSITVL